MNQGLQDIICSLCPIIYNVCMPSWSVENTLFFIQKIPYQDQSYGIIKFG